jgi:prolyl oligopeptidase
MRYPPARKADVVDTFHGVRVHDPYRWLEDASSPETVAWVTAQNALTRSIVDGPVRDGIAGRLTALYGYPRTSVPFRRGNRYFFARNETGLLKQPVLFYKEGPDGEPRVLLDPNALDAEGTTALTAMAVNDQGTLMAYALSHAGSDRQDIAIRDVATGRDVPDRLRWVKFASIAWTKDGAGFYYTRFPEPGAVAPGDENYFSKVYYHLVGDYQSGDALILARPDQRETVFSVEVSDDDRWVVITAFQGSSDKSEIYLLDRASPEDRLLHLFDGFHAAWSFVQSSSGRLYFHTDRGAPMGRIVSIDARDPSRPPVEVVPESNNKLSTAIIAGHHIVASYLRDASDHLRFFRLNGTPSGELELGMASLTGLTGRPEDPEFFFGTTSFITPPANHRYSFGDRAVHPFDAPSAPVDPAAYEAQQVWYTSKDGTRVSMFLVRRRDLPKDGHRPVLLTGYGGFNISLTPSFDPANFVLLDRGGIFAVANLRGGGEYGEAWHRAGMFERKQNVFDDFIAAAEWLVASGYTNPKQLAIEGGSNGGLLTAAVMIQRPDLFGAVICRVPVADMLRYHLFTVGRFWISEYGCADDAEQFPYLYQYSPYHNVKDGVAYPPVLVMTADTDDRVDPGMAKKFAARLQEASAGGPVLIRVEVKAGHGAGKPVSKMIEEDADIFAFLTKYLEL